MLAIIGVTYTGPDRVRALSVYGIALGLAAAGGQLVGATMQQVGNALGVAVTGVLFFGALDGRFAHAFEITLAELALLCVAVAALTRLLPRPARAS